MMDPSRIICVLCKKPVQRTEWWDDPLTDIRTLRVHCHGATQEMRLDMLDVGLQTLQALRHAQGVAFENAVLAAPSIKEDA